MAADSHMPGAGIYARPVTRSRDPHLINVLGALALALADAIRDATEAATGMTGAAPAALVALRQFLAGRTTQDLAQATGLTHSGAVRLIDRLADSGLVERTPGHDGRSLSIVLTAKGRALSRKITAARATAIEATLDGLDADDRRALLPLVDTLVTTITAQRLSARADGDEPTGWLCRLCDFASCGRPCDECPAANTAQANATATSAPQSDLTIDPRRHTTNDAQERK
jgi:MarR family transcriptional regulator, negative regulator of the multidrug operon emrRAB